MMAPIGYLNAPASLDDQKNRIVIIDPQRGPLGGLGLRDIRLWRLVLEPFGS